MVALVGGVFYASALSLLSFDAYSLGYDAPLAAMAIVAAATFFWHGVRDWAWLIVAAAVVWALDLGHSVNAWDAMLDAPFWVACCAIAIRATWRALKRLSGAARLKATGTSA